MSQVFFARSPKQWKNEFNFPKKNYFRQNVQLQTLGTTHRAQAKKLLPTVLENLKRICFFSQVFIPIQVVSLGPYKTVSTASAISL